MSINIACSAFHPVLNSLYITQDVLHLWLLRPAERINFHVGLNFRFSLWFSYDSLANLSCFLSVCPMSVSSCVMAITSKQNQSWQVQIKISRGRFQDRAVKPAVLGWRNAPVTGPIRVPLAFRVATAVIFLRIRMVELILVLINVGGLDVRLNVQKII